MWREVEKEEGVQRQRGREETERKRSGVRNRGRRTGRRKDRRRDTDQEMFLLKV